MISNTFFYLITYFLMIFMLTMLSFTNYSIRVCFVSDSKNRPVFNSQRIFKKLFTYPFLQTIGRFKIKCIV
uniref:Uncharacterized protein n=1 Tax=Panstrongylus lignarius TaxID=156445 RepID=A0A224Y4N0_9HEMI